MDTKSIADKLDKWLDILNYWGDEIAEIGENFPNTSGVMANKYDKMVDEMYNLYKQLTKGDK